jgi:hypothetical protein
MTNFEALKGKLNYPLPENSFYVALINRGLDWAGYYTIANKDALELAQADLIYTLVTAPNISEGGYQVSLSDKKTLIQLADSIFSKHGIQSPLKASVTIINPW